MFFKRKPRVLFVCTENICRSPMAEGLMRYHLRQSGRAGGVKVNSAGTRVSSPGARPDPRACKLASAVGVRLGRIRAKSVSVADLRESDFILAMDEGNREDLLTICPPEHQHKISLLLACMPGQEFEDVPDPYYASSETFSEVYLLIERAVIRLITTWPFSPEHQYRAEVPPL